MEAAIKAPISRPSIIKLLYATAGIRASVSEDIPWYLSGGIPAGSCIAAYKAKGAASLAASYTNLANPGTYDVSSAAPPTLDSSLGWVFNGVDQYLTIGNSGFMTKPFSIIARVKRGANIERFDGLITGTSNCLDFAMVNAGIKNRATVIGWDIIAESNSVLAINTAGVVGFSYASNGAYAFYFNGSPDGAGTNNLNSAEKANTIGISSAYYYLGSIAAWAAYSIVLTANQFAAVTTTINAL